MDVRGFLGLVASVPKGFTEIRVNFKLDAAPEHLHTPQDLTGFTPVLNTLTQEVNVEIQVALQ